MLSYREVTFALQIYHLTSNRGKNDITKVGIKTIPRAIFSLVRREFEQKFYYSKYVYLLRNTLQALARCITKKM